MSGIIGGAGSKSGVIGTTELDYEEGTFTPTYAGFAVGNGSSSAIYVKVGNIVFCSGSITFGSTSSFTGRFVITMPYARTIGGSGTAYLQDWGVATYIVAGSVSDIYGSNNLTFSDGTGENFLSSTNPFTWGDTDRFGWSATFYTTA